MDRSVLLLKMMFACNKIMHEKLCVAETEKKSVHELKSQVESLTKRLDKLNTKKDVKTDNEAKSYKVTISSLDTKIDEMQSEIAERDYLNAALRDELAIMQSIMQAENAPVKPVEVAKSVDVDYSQSRKFISDCVKSIVSTFMSFITETQVIQFFQMYLYGHIAHGVDGAVSILREHNKGIVIPQLPDFSLLNYNEYARLYAISNEPYASRRAVVMRDMCEEYYKNVFLTIKNSN